MTAGLGRLLCATAVLSGCLAGGGCVYSGGSVDPLERPGPPLGVTVLRVPFEKFVIPPPPPGGFSSTYQKRVLERQRLARQQAAREEKAQAESVGQSDKPAANAPPATPR